MEEQRTRHNFEPFNHFQRSAIIDYVAIKCKAA